MPSIVAAMTGRNVPKGDRAAAEGRFERLFAAHSRAILAYALRRTRRAEDAADVLGEVMLIAWRRLDEVPTGDGTRPWLFAVARRVLANQSRADTRRLRLTERLKQDLREELVDGGAADVRSEAGEVHAALTQLSASDRELVLLIAWEGLSPSQAARALGIGPAAARTRLHRARRRLKRALADDVARRLERKPQAGGLLPRMEDD